MSASHDFATHDTSTYEVTTPDAAQLEAAQHDVTRRAVTRPRRWADAWHDSLYGERGFYRRDEGPAGHFATSAQGIPGVDVVLANAVVALADSHDADVIVDFACGRGELITACHELDPERNLVGVDVVARPSTVPRLVRWVRSPGGRAVPCLGLDGRRALVLAHEWLDVVPCPIAEVDDAGRLREVWVDRDGVETLGPPLSGASLAWAQEFWSTASPGERVEVGLARDEAWSSLVEAVTREAAPGSVVVGVDYAHTGTRRPPLGTLTGYANGSQTSPIPDGSCDLTAHVAVDSLQTDRHLTQRELLFDLFGTSPLDPVPIGLAHSDPPTYIARLSARSAFAAATASDGLGGFVWWFKQV